MNDDTEQWLKDIKAKQDLVEQRDREAKEAGTLVGRYISEPYADGYALYEIIRVLKTKVEIEVITGEDFIKDHAFQSIRPTELVDDIELRPLSDQYLSHDKGKIYGINKWLKES